MWYFSNVLLVVLEKQTLDGSNMYAGGRREAEMIAFWEIATSNFRAADALEQTGSEEGVAGRQLSTSNDWQNPLFNLIRYTSPNLTVTV